MKVWTIVSTILLVSSKSAVFGFSPLYFGTRGPLTTALNTATVDNQEPYAIDENRRWTMNMLVLGSATVTVGALAVPYLAFFMPPKAGGVGGAVVAQDQLGKDILAAEYLSSKPAGDRSLVLGLQGDATYLIVKDDNTLENFGLNAVCTHLGCIVPWSPAINKFQCPCHGSQYAPDGSVVRGPAPLPLALEHVNVDDSGKVLFTPWTETDFRTGETGWWM